MSKKAKISQFPPKGKNETLWDYFVRNAAGKSYDEQIGVISVINAGLLGVFDGFYGKEKIVKTAKEIVEFGYNFEDYFGGNEVFYEKMYENWGCEPFVLRMFDEAQDILRSESVKNGMAKASEELKEYVKRFMSDVDGDEHPIVVFVNEMDDEEYFDELHMAFDEEDVANDYEGMVSAVTGAFEYAKEQNAIILVQIIGTPSMVYAFVFDGDGELPKPISNEVIQSAYNGDNSSVVFKEYDVEKKKMLA